MILDILTKHHDKWTSYAEHCLYNRKDLAGDVVNDMYLKLHELLKDNHERILNDDGELKIGYVYLAIKSVAINLMKREGKYSNHNADESTSSEGEDNGSNSLYDIVDDTRDLSEELDDLETKSIKDSMLKELVDDILEDLEGMEWFNSTLFKVYISGILQELVCEPTEDEDIEDSPSIRRIAAETTISQSTVFETIKLVKARIRYKFMYRYKAILKIDGDLDRMDALEENYTIHRKMNQLSMFEDACSEDHSEPYFSFLHRDILDNMVKAYGITDLLDVALDTDRTNSDYVPQIIGEHSTKAEAAVAAHKRVQKEELGLI